MTSIRARLLRWLIVPLSLVASLVSVEAFFSVRSVSNNLHDRTLQTVLLTLTEHMRANENELVTENLLEVLTESLGDQFFYHFVAPDNAWVVGYGGVPLRPRDTPLANGQTLFYDGDYQGSPVRAVAARQFVSLDSVQGWTTLTVWQRINQRRTATLMLFGDSLVRLALLVIMAGLVTWWAVARGLRPLGDLREAVAKRTPDDLSPIQRAVPQELRPVAMTMNDLFGRLSAAGTARERLIGDAAHQLRNPVAALRTQSQNVLAAGTLEEAQQRAKGLVDSSNHLGRLVDQMLVSARSNAGAVTRDDPVDLVAMVSQVLEAYGARAIERRQELSFDKDAAAVYVLANEDLLREAFTNLIDNAIRHNASGVSIHVAVSRPDASAYAKVSIADTGVPLSAARFDELCAAFRTGDGATAGSGLGLSIVADIVRLHDGMLQLASEPDGKCISVALPSPM